MDVGRDSKFPVKILLRLECSKNNTIYTESKEVVDVLVESEVTEDIRDVLRKGRGGEEGGGVRVVTMVGVRVLALGYYLACQGAQHPSLHGGGCRRLRRHYRSARWNFDQEMSIFQIF